MTSSFLWTKPPFVDKKRVKKRLQCQLQHCWQLTWHISHLQPHVIADPVSKEKKVTSFSEPKNIAFNRTHSKSPRNDGQQGDSYKNKLNYRYRKLAFNLFSDWNWLRWNDNYANDRPLPSTQRSFTIGGFATWKEIHWNCRRSHHEIIILNKLNWSNGRISVVDGGIECILQQNALSQLLIWPAINPFSFASNRLQGRSHRRSGCVTLTYRN